MKRRYLKTAEDVIALKDTDTKIFEEVDERFNEGSYHKFINGVPCRFDSNKGEWQVNISIWSEDKPYILEEEKVYEKPVQEATEDDLGCLCYCWDEEDDKEELGILEEYDPSDDDKYHITDLGWFQHCRRLSPSEVAELTGYKVEEAE